MKKFNLIAPIILSVILFSCVKENIELSKKKNSLIASIVLPPDANSEVDRIFNDVIDYDYHFGISYSSNLGRPEDDFSHVPYFSGSTPNNTTLRINGNPFSDQEGQWILHGGDFGSFYGSTVSLSFTNSTSGDSHYVDLYIPIPHQISFIGLDNTLNINKTGNTLNWTVDNSWASNKVAFYYSLHSSEFAPAIEQDVLIIDNIGSFNIDHLTSKPNCNFIKFKLVSGNTTSFTINGKKVLFDISTHDFHQYFIK